MSHSGTPAPRTQLSLNSLIMGLDPMVLLALFRRRLRLFLAVFIVLMSLVVWSTVRLPPMYTASADVLIDYQRSRSFDAQAILAGLSSDNNTIDTQVQILMSRQMAERVVKKLNLQNDPDFNPTLAPPKPGLKEKIFGADRKPAPRRPDPNSQAVIDFTTQVVMGGLSVQRQGLTYIMAVKYTAANPNKAVQIANAFADEYIVDQLEARTDATRRVNTWLGDHLSSLQNEVAVADAAVQQYKIANNLMSAQGATITEAEVSDISRQITNARADLATKQAKLNTAREQLASGGGGGDVAAVLGSGTIMSLRQQETEASNNLAEIQQTKGPRHPDYVRAETRLKDIKTRIQEEITRQLSNLEADVNVARAQLTSLENSQGAAKGSLASNNRAQVGLASLQAKSEASHRIYESMLNQSKETNASTGIEQPDARVLSYAKSAFQSFPNTRLATLFGFALGLIGGVAAVGLAELLETGYSTAEAVEARLGVNYLASLPLAPKRRRRGRKPSPPQDFLAQYPLSAFAEAFRNLRASILLGTSKSGGTPQVVAICSSLPHEGKTVTSVGLMRTFALAGSNVVLIDGDLRRRGVSKAFPPAGSGLVEVLDGSVSIDDALISDPLSGGYVMSVVATPSSGEDLLGSTKMDQLIEKLRAQFDIVIIDTPPVLALAEARLISAKVDGVVFIVRWRRTPGRAAFIGLNTLRESDANVLGVALSQVDLERQRSYGYGDSTYYYTRYKDYYTA